MIIISELFKIGLNLVTKISHNRKKSTNLLQNRQFKGFSDKKPLFIWIQQFKGVNYE